MAEPILMPALSPTMTEGKILRWLVKEGSMIKSGEPICEIETDKAVIEFEAVDEGICGKILFPDESEGIAVNTTIGWILAEGETAADIPQTKQAATEDLSGDQQPAQAGQQVIELASEQKTSDQAVVKSPSLPNGKRIDADTRNARPFSSPLARRLAKEKSIDLSSVKGSGPRGRIILRDIEAYDAGGHAAQHSVKAFTADPLSLETPYTVMKLTNMRKTVARRLTESKTSIPHFYLTKSVEVDRLLEIRSLINNRADGKYKISVNDCIIKAVAMAMQEVPEINVSWQDDGCHCFERVDLSVAVALDDGLITPVLRGVDGLGLKSISSTMRELAGRARDGKLLPHEYGGGSLTISNLGMYGIDHFQAIINPPQASILAVGRSETVPRFNADGNVVPITTMCLTLSVDHRAVDGAVGARFLAALENFISEPASMLV